MGKSLDNYIGLAEPPFDMMKKFMQLPDGVMRLYFELLTDLPLAEIDARLAGHPKTAKVALAKSVISQYHPAGEADAAADRWQREIGEGALPTDIPTATIPAADLTDGAMRADLLLKTAGLCVSAGEARPQDRGRGRLPRRREDPHRVARPDDSRRRRPDAVGRQEEVLPGEVLVRTADAAESADEEQDQRAMRDDSFLIHRELSESVIGCAMAVSNHLKMRAAGEGV